MSRLVMCKKLHQELPALERIPYPGEVGKRIFDSISKTAWEMWIKHQTMLINEYRLDSSDVNARNMLRGEMENFLFGEDSKTR